MKWSTICVNGVAGDKRVMGGKKNCKNKQMKEWCIRAKSIHLF